MKIINKKIKIDAAGALTGAVREYIRANGLIKPGDKILIGVSGGPDSAALLDILFTLRHELGAEIAVAHFNHGLRRGAKADENFTRALAARYNLKFFAGAWGNGAKKPASGIEEKARQARLKFFAQTMKRGGYTKLALAHTQNDVAETFLMRIIRGSGLKGLQTILPGRELEGMTVIRPLLAVGKPELLAYLRGRGLDYRTDPTNRQNDFTRNAVRNDLLPRLAKSYNPNIISVLADASGNMAVDYDFIAAQAEAVFAKLAQPGKSKGKIAFSLKPFCRQHPAMQKMLLRLACEKLAGDLNGLDYRHWKEVEGLITARPNESIVNLPRSLKVRKTAASLVLEKHSMSSRTN